VSGEVAPGFTYPKHVKKSQAAVKVCQEYFNFELPSVMTEKRIKTFLSRLSRLDTLACYLVQIS